MTTLNLGTEDVERAAALLRAGKLVALPTETVYGLAADAMNAEAVRRVFATKGRPADNPLIVHFGDAADLLIFCRSAEPSPQRGAEEVARALKRLDRLVMLMPGPVTAVVPAPAALPTETRGGLDTVAVRIPDHTLARDIIAAAAIPVAAPSANRSGRPSPVSAEMVTRELGGRIAAVVDGGPCRVGIESTVVDLCASTVTILRAGATDGPTIAHALREDVVAAASSPLVARSPGTRHRHYQPTVPVWIGTREEVEAARHEVSRAGLTAAIFNASNAQRAARTLYVELVTAERLQADVMLVILPEGDDAYAVAVRDRLEHAALGRLTDATGWADAPLAP